MEISCLSDANINMMLNYVWTTYMPVIVDNYWQILAVLHIAYVCSTLYLLWLRKIICGQMPLGSVENVSGYNAGWCELRDYTNPSFKPHYTPYMVGRAKMHMLLGGVGMWLYSGDLEGDADVPATRWTLRLVLFGLFMFLLMTSTASYFKPFIHEGEYTYLYSGLVLLMYGVTILTMGINAMMNARPITIFKGK